MQRLIYLSSFEYPSTHAHPLHALLMARAFHKALGDQFLFVVGGGVRDSSLGTVPHASPFKGSSSLIKFLHLRSVGYALWLFYFLLRNRVWRENLIIFTNDLRLAAVASFIKNFFKFMLVCEVHGTSGLLDNLVARRADKIVFVTEGLKDLFEKSYTGITNKSTVISNGVDFERFAGVNGAGIRKQLGLPEDTKVIAYTGRFKPMQSDKGITFLIDTVSSLPENVQLLLVGGTETEVEEMRIYAETQGVSKRVVIVGHVPVDQVPSYTAAADILAYVPPRTDAFLARETSPMKLFEYMAIGKPIIASDLAAFREALGEGTAQFITPGSKEEFIKAVQEILAGGEEIASQTTRATERASRNSWNARAERILDISKI
ncbi:MAG: hypothetical protein JWN64_2 [Parcubacteria group bacterium]|nr:hypothetical protein [Parcubacteria group bacterium]